MESVLNAIFRCIIAMAANAARAPGRIASANRPVVIVPVALPHRRTLPKIHNGQYQFRIGHATEKARFVRPLLSLVHCRVERGIVSTLQNAICDHDRQGSGSMPFVSVTVSRTEGEYAKWRYRRWVTTSKIRARALPF